MAYILTVISPFDGYKVGDQISDAGLVASILASERQDHVIKVDSVTGGAPGHPSAENIPLKVRQYSALINRPTAADFGVGQCQIDGTVYVSDGVNWDKPLKQVATRCKINNKSFSIGAGAGLIARSKHHASDDITKMAVGFWNGRLLEGTPPATTNETFAAASTYQAHVEDINGNVLSVFTWGGGNNTKAAASGEVFTSDLMALSRTLRKGEAFFIKHFRAPSDGNAIVKEAPNVSTYPGPADSGEGIIWGSYTTANNGIGTGGAIATTNLAYTSSPQLILAHTATRSFAIVGDSRQAGIVTTGPRAMVTGYGKMGTVEHALHNLAPVVNLALSSDRASYFLSYGAIRTQLAAYCSDIIIAYGINDIVTGGKNETQIFADYSSISALFPQSPCWGVTVTPLTTGTFTTTAGQTRTATNATRARLNYLIRQLKPPFSGYIDIAKVIEYKGLVTRQVNTTASNATIPVADTTGLEVGDMLFGPGLDSGATIQSLVANTSVTVDVPPSFSLPNNIIQVSSGLWSPDYTNDGVHENARSLMAIEESRFDIFADL